MSIRGLILERRFRNGRDKPTYQNTGIIAVGGMATKLVSFLLLPLYTSVLSTADYGTVDYINTIALFCVPAVSLLMDEALFRFLIDCRTDEDRSTAVTASCAVLLAGCVCFAVMAILVWLLFEPENLGWVVGLVVAGALLQMASAVLRGFGDTVGYSVMNFAASAFTICSMFSLSPFFAGALWVCYLQRSLRRAVLLSCSW